MPGTLDQRKIYAIRSFGLNVIMHFSNEQYGSAGKARITKGSQAVRRYLFYYKSFNRPARIEILCVK
jgi:hypothetical protein